MEDTKFRQFHGRISAKPTLMATTLALVSERGRRLFSDTMDLVQRWYAIARYGRQHGETDVGAVDVQ